MIARGRPPCDHRRLAGEKYLGADTGDDACLDCGAELPRSADPASTEMNSTMKTNALAGLACTARRRKSSARKASTMPMQYLIILICEKIAVFDYSHMRKDNRGVLSFPRPRRLADVLEVRRG